MPPSGNMLRRTCENGPVSCSCLPEKKCRLFADIFVSGRIVDHGTAARFSAITPGYGAIICHAEAHIAVDECNSPEHFTGGAKIIGLHGPAGKFTPAQVEKTLKGFIRGETIGYDDYVAGKGEQGAKDAGKFRLEGKEYVTRDGDVYHFRFNV